MDVSDMDTILTLLRMCPKENKKTKKTKPYGDTAQTQLQQSWANYVVLKFLGWGDVVLVHGHSFKKGLITTYLLVIWPKYKLPTIDLKFCTLPTFSYLS